MLRYLVENPQRLITHDELLEALWPETYVQPQILRTYVLELRKLLGDDAEQPRFIQTVPKRGYRFLAMVTDVASAAADSPLLSIVGRNPELEALRNHFAGVGNGDRATVFVTGEPGIGKTYLIDAFCAQLGGAGNRRIARGQCLEGFAGKEAFYPVREALNSLCAADEKTRTLLTNAAPSWFTRTGAFTPLLGEICEALEFLSQNESLLLIFEDIHWADSSTLDLISALARRRSRSRIMLLASFRPADIDAQHPLRRLGQDLLTSGRSHELRLGPLNKQAIGDYLRRELHAETLPPGLTSLIHQQCAGNPLFMTAVLDHLRSRRVLFSEDGIVRLTLPLSEIELGVPDRLAGIIELQLERLEDDDRLLLEAGSIAGTIFPSWSAAAALGRGMHEVEEAYARLVRRVHLLTIAGQDELPDGSNSTFYVFAHALYREVLYARIPASRRSLWHHRVANRLREMFAGHEAQVAHEIAAHADAAAGARSVEG